MKSAILRVNKPKKFARRRILNPNYFRHSADQIIRECRSLNAPDVFSIGCQEQFHVSIHEQQSRSLNLIWALNEKKILRQGMPIAVVGAGIAGCTASVAAALLGARVLQLEESNRILSKFDRAKHRWIHPHFFNQGLFADDWTDLPILNWRSDNAQSLSKLFKLKFDSYQRALDENLEVRFNCKAVGIDLEYDRYYDPITTLNWIDEESSRKTLVSESFELIILAVGFGSDEWCQELSGGGEVRTKSYWDVERESRSGASGNTVFISGCGDGGIVDLLTHVISDFQHPKFRSVLPGLPGLAVKQLEQAHEEFNKRLEEIDKLSHLDYLRLRTFTRNKKFPVSLEQYRARELKKLNREIASSYRYFAKQVARLQPDFMKYFRSKLKRRSRVILNSRSPTPYNPYTSIWNQLVLAMIEYNDAFEYVPGEVRGVRRLKSGALSVEVDHLGKMTRIRTNSLIQRYGQKADFKKIFGNIAFNPLPREVRNNHETESNILEDLEQKLMRRNRKPIERNELVSSIHSWNDRRGRKITRDFLFDLSSRDAGLQGRSAGIMAAKRLLKIAARCDHFDCVAVQFGTQEPDQAFLEAFRHSALAGWKVSFPRIIYFHKIDGLGDEALKRIGKYFRIPHEFFENYLDVADSILQSDIAEND